MRIKNNPAPVLQYKKMENAAEKLLNTSTQTTVGENGRVDIIQIAKELGGKIKVAETSDIATEQDYSLIIIDDNYFTITVAKNTSPKRDRFTIAHEIGHFLMHYKTDKIRKKFLRYESPVITKEEVEANQFAAILLMPRQQFIEQYAQIEKDETTINKLAANFEVSKSAVEFRIGSLKLDTPRNKPASFKANGSSAETKNSIAL